MGRYGILAHCLLAIVSGLGASRGVCAQTAAAADTGGAKSADTFVLRYLPSVGQEYRYRVRYVIQQNDVGAPQLERCETVAELAVVVRATQDDEVTKRVRFVRLEDVRYKGSEVIELDDRARQGLEAARETEIEVRETTAGQIKSVSYVSEKKVSAVKQFYESFCRVELPDEAVGRMAAWDVASPAAKRVSNSLEVVRYVLDDVERKDGKVASVRLSGQRVEVSPRIVPPSPGKETTERGAKRFNVFCAKDVITFSTLLGAVTKRKVVRWDTFQSLRGAEVQGYLEAEVELISTREKAEAETHEDEAKGRGLAQ